MAGFTSYNDILAAIVANQVITGEATFPGGDEPFTLFKSGPTCQGAGTWMSLWYATGFPAAGVSPAVTPGTAYDDTAGGILFQPDQSPLIKHLLSWGAHSSVQASYLLYDRLVGVAGVALAAPGNQTIESVALPRYTDGIGVCAALEISTPSTAAGTFSLNSYTNEHDAESAGPSFSLPAAVTVLRAWIPVPLKAGDHGIKHASTINMSVVATAAVCTFVLYKPLAVLALPTSCWNEKDLVLQLAALPCIYDGATLALLQMPTATTATTFWSQLRAAYN